MEKNTESNYDFSHPLLEDLFFHPWVFWFEILSVNTAPALIGLVSIIIILLLIIKMTTHPYIYSGLFFIWIGPVLKYLPFLLAFIIPNTLSGKFTMTIGCVENSKGGLDCI